MLRRPRFSLATWSLFALVAGLALGLLGHATAAPGFRTVERFITPAGSLWIAALQMLVLPLVVSQLLAAIAGAGAAKEGGIARLGGRTLVLFIAMLLGAGLLTLPIVTPLVAIYEPDPALRSSVHSLTAGADADAALSGPATTGPRFPTNLVDVARSGQLLPLLVFVAVLGAAVTQLPEARRTPLIALFRGFADAMMIVVRWILVATPFAVFVLTYTAALDAGGGAAGMMGAFIAIVCAMLALFVVLLYPVTVVAGKVPLRTFAKAVAPAQLVAISTLSSLAALPALVQGGTDHLRLPSRFTGFVLPLAASIFKMNRPVSATTKLVFLAHVYGIALTPGTIAVFLATVLVLSFGAAGVPNGGQAFTTLPAYVAAGLPVEGVILLEATSMAPDMLKTILNVTGHMSAAAILSRADRSAALAPTDLRDAIEPSENAA